MMQIDSKGLTFIDCFTTWSVRHPFFVTLTGLSILFHFGGFSTHCLLIQMYHRIVHYNALIFRIFINKVQLYRLPPQISG